MTAAVETMAYAGETPWHGLGTKVENTLTAHEMMVAAGLDWKVIKSTVHKADGTVIPNEYCLERETDGRVLSMAGEGYKIVQNEESFDFFKKFVDGGHMQMETAGSLWDGRYVWGLARIGKDFALGREKEDEVLNYLLMCAPHKRGHAMLMQTTAIRVVCWNTLTFAIGSNLKGKGGKVFRMSHATKFDDTQKNLAERAVGLATEQAVEFQAAATLLSSKRATAVEVEEYFCQVLDYDPNEAEEKVNGERKEPRSLPKFRLALEHSPGAELATARGTWWGALNAVTRVVDHESGGKDSRENGTALKNAWMGHLANVKRKALDFALVGASKSDKSATKAKKAKVLA